VRELLPVDEADDQRVASVVEHRKQDAMAAPAQRGVADLAAVLGRDPEGLLHRFGHDRIVGVGPKDRGGRAGCAGRPYVQGNSTLGRTCEKVWRLRRLIRFPDQGSPLAKRTEGCFSLGV